VLRWHFRAQLRRQCAHAAAGCYVTGAALQRRYPLPPGALSVAASDVDLGEDAFVSTPRRWDAAPAFPRLVFVGTLAQLYKAPDILVEAVGRCAQRGRPVELDLLGDGAHRAELAQRAARLGVAARVRFHGHVPAGPAVRDHLDRADVFVLPSRQEGLPRALVEAMARGLPCLGSRVGGIPELLEADEMVAAGDADALADLIIARAYDATWLTAASARNHQKAGSYRRPLLDARHRDFLTRVQDVTATWLGGRA
jgi:glycosyltransferase involved in cell wall biosynthesis